MIKKMKIEGLDCPNCAKALEGQLNGLASVNSVTLDFLKSIITIDSDIMELAIKDVVKLTKQIEPDANIIVESEKRTSNKFILDLLILILGISVGACVLFVEMPTEWFWSLYVLSALILGYKTYYKAIRLLFKGVINENLLVTLSILGASLVGEHMEGLMVIALYSIGKLLEGVAVDKSRKSIEKLTNFQVDYAYVLRDGKEVKVDPSEVEIGEVILVKPGERVPLDGQVVYGSATLNLQSLTGESLPVNVGEGDKILSGSIVLDTALKIQVTQLYKDSTVTRIMNLIENASEKKSKTETIISKFSKWYTLGVMVIAIIVGVIVGLITGDVNEGVYRGLIFLVVSCPCAFAISVPLTYFSGMGNAAKCGILIKGSNYLDALASVNMVAFDKTGTITTGEFEVEFIQSFDEVYKNEDILYLASIGERYSVHPLAVSICSACKKELCEASDVKEVAGEGVYYKYNSDSYFVGKKDKELNGTYVELYKNDVKIGQIKLVDKLKSSAVNAFYCLRQDKIQTVILSGDNTNVVQSIAKRVEADYFFSKLLPEDKYNKIANYQNDGTHVCYVGDGLNDAPSLMIADVGVSMGIKGNAASIEASDVVIVDDNPLKVAHAIKISKKTRQIVWQNIIFSALIKIVFLTLGALGITGMLAAVIADVGVTLIAILNSLRALKYNPNKGKIILLTVDDVFDIASNIID